MKTVTCYEMWHDCNRVVPAEGSGVTDWSPLATTDPVPGDPGAVALLARRLRSTAEDLRCQATRLRAVRADDFWDGHAARVFSQHQRDLPPRIDAVVGRYARVAGALDRYHPKLAEAQTMARRALTQARQAEIDGHAAALGVAAMEAHDRAAVAAADASSASHPQSPPRPPAPWPGPDWHARLREANDRLDAARGLLLAAQDVRDEASRTCARVLHHAVDDELVTHTSWGDFAGWVERLGPVTKPLLLAPHLVRPAAHLAQEVAAVVSYEVHHPIEALKLGADTVGMLGGEGLALLGGGGEALGIAFDATGVGAAIGVPTGVVSAAAVATGLGTAAAFAHRMGDDVRHAVSETSESHAASAEESPLRRVSGGDLEAHERAGGHTLEKHVGRTAEDLSNRLAREPHLRSASTFLDRASAESSIAQTLDANKDAIDSWLRAGGRGRDSAFTASFRDAVGTVLRRGASEPIPSSTVRVVLRPDPTMPEGYRIQTAFPE